MPTDRLPLCALFFEAGNSSQSITWVKRMIALTSGLGRLGVVRLPGLNRHNSSRQWIGGMIQCRSQWRLLNLFLFLLSSPTYYYAVNLSLFPVLCMFG